MENASKALIIAGAILLSILIIALGMTVYNNSSSVTEGMDMTSQEISSFNAKFLAYQGKQKGSQVRSLVSMIQSNNNQYKDRKISVAFTNAINKTPMNFITNNPKVGTAFNAEKKSYVAWIAHGGDMVANDDNFSTDSANNYTYENIFKMTLEKGSGIRNTSTYKVSFDYNDNGIIWIAIIQPQQ